MVLKSCKYDWPSHIVTTFQSLRSVSNFCRIVCDSNNFRLMLPRIYVPYPEILPKPNKDNGIRVNLQRVIKKAGSFSGVAIELKKILNHQQWHKTWLNLRLLAYGWYIIEKNSMEL